MQICVYWKCMKLDISLTCKKSPCFLPVKTKEMNKETKQKTLSFIRSSLPEVFCKKGVLRNLTKFTRKHLFQSLFFNKVAGLRYIKFLWVPFLTEHFRWLLLFHNIKNNPIQITRTLKSSNWNKNDKDQNWRDKNSYWWLKYNINPFLISTVELSVLRFKK